MTLALIQNPQVIFSFIGCWGVKGPVLLHKEFSLQRSEIYNRGLYKYGLRCNLKTSLPHFSIVTKSKKVGVNFDLIGGVPQQQ